MISLQLRKTAIEMLAKRCASAKRSHVGECKRYSCAAPIQFARRLESEIYRQSLGDIHTFRIQIKRLSHALAQQPDLAEMMSIEPADTLISMPDHDLIDAAANAEAEAEMEASADAGNAILTCPKCGSMKVSWYQRQTRSADEPFTVFAKCKTCGHEWRYNA